MFEIPHQNISKYVNLVKEWLKSMSRLLVTTECRTNVTREDINSMPRQTKMEYKSNVKNIKISSAVLRDLDINCQTVVRKTNLQKSYDF